ncbi:MAG: DDE-type integrase/transposase/recombinase [Candidatus Bathyarchaeia archaeon]
MRQIVLSREEKGRLIAEKPNQIQRLDEQFYRVNSQSHDICYEVILRKNGSWICNCLDYYHRQLRCKHIIAVEISLKLREQVQESIIIQPVEIHACLFCRSESLKKFGVRHNRSGDIQRFLCASCGRTFSVNLGFERMKHNPQAITTAMQLYFSGESLRNTAKSLRLLGVQVTHRTILNWIRKYVVLMQKYLDKITPQVSDTWRADEMFLKVKGNLKYLYALMDDQTRFWIAQEVANTKFTADVRPLLQLGKQVAGKQPKTFITDGAPNFHEAYRKEFWTQNVATRTEHVRDIRISGNIHNNKMERMNGEIRDREKVMRSIKRTDTPILTGYQLFHNYIRPHEALDGKTPSEACGISVKGKDKWLTIIQNASQH